MTAPVTPITETCFMCRGSGGLVENTALGFDVRPEWVPCPNCQGRGITVSAHIHELRLKRSLRAPRRGRGR